MALKLLDCASYDRQMNALDEVRVLSEESQQQQQQQQQQWLTDQRLAEWMQQHCILRKLLRSNLHHREYVNHVVCVMRFLSRVPGFLSLDDLDMVWDSAVGKHEAIVANVHWLLSEIACQLAPEQLDHLFQRFELSQAACAPRELTRLLSLVRTFAEKDSNGIVAKKVLELLWKVATNKSQHTEVCNESLKICMQLLDRSLLQDELAKFMNRCLENIKGSTLAVPALKLLQGILVIHSRRYHNDADGTIPDSPDRQKAAAASVDGHLDLGVPGSWHDHWNSIAGLVVDSTARYMEAVAAGELANSDGPFGHEVELQERIKLLTYVLNKADLSLCEERAEKLWVCLTSPCGKGREPVTDAVFRIAAGLAYRVFSNRLAGERVDPLAHLTGEAATRLFERHVSGLSPLTLTCDGYTCFKDLFLVTNQLKGHLEHVVQSREGSIGVRHVNTMQCAGVDKLWTIALTSPDTQVSTLATDLLTKLSVQLSPQLQEKKREIREHHIANCMQRLSELTSDEQSKQAVARCVHILRKYVYEIEHNFRGVRKLPPTRMMSRGPRWTIKLAYSQKQTRFQCDAYQTVATTKLRIKLRFNLVPSCKARPFRRPSNPTNGLGQPHDPTHEALNP